MALAVLLRRRSHRNVCGYSHRCRDEMKAVNVVKVNYGHKAQDDCSASNSRGRSRRGTCSFPGPMNPVADGPSGKAKQLQSGSEKLYAQRQLQDCQHRADSASEQRGRHLVRLMEGDDVRLAMQALQLAAQIHDQIWGQRGADAGDEEPPGRRQEALLEAASPLYDTAMAAARAIQHRALHSLVKQAVRRYVNPFRGSPDDVLRVILELLTGCGGGAAAAPVLLPSGKAAAAAAAAAAAGNRVTSRCLSDVGSGNRGCFRESTPEHGWQPSSQSSSPSLDHSDGLSMVSSSSSSSSRRSPNCRHQRVSFGSSPGSRYSARSSLDSNGSRDSSSLGDMQARFECPCQ
ncbi:hypothetical protein VOLCADRAFT_99014 [Volvox carteri f. nagariensis]|uniref:Uncharacterized protein n=1 Tax=Volvox carteri f. nagariensis TaxID=3068 RepID=D8UGU2_VOLCA|nr:uncharacterized protein VOLCADRAFT_99014 [Volvox carteri f. nagariensis]EFJ41040.1 hypothetical protein VOLCADRAFT_99014 [Volvox carteri f. nagariensis]|eukprot:XP_002957904.1 hypothetical protein VOLCADRAFT_99014 [Volvox carteri f. nagariensis]